MTAARAASNRSLAQPQHPERNRAVQVTIINQPFWTVVPTWCTGVSIVNVSIMAPTWSPNTDGIVRFLSQLKPIRKLWLISWLARVVVLTAVWSR